MEICLQIFKKKKKNCDNQIATHNDGIFLINNI